MSDKLSGSSDEGEAETGAPVLAETAQRGPQDEETKPAESAVESREHELQERAAELRESGQPILAKAAEVEAEELDDATH